ncbi:DUF2062 domain-containing protein [Roseibium litorale]|uniref:DUF2062 domain-containing protein n=1 Tax=Roseibium litorale TaxID=2803841 RepID=A0ABR9CTW4_9HYPH|nr:DUF2062 domain-containing protein [Roseibium litorale]MBD8894302.1 DUF2062 domain-containing protein [Roseibium litorale]
MLFRRRQKPTRIESLRVAVWPRHSWVRSTRYYGKRVLRLTASPHAIALGFAAGAFTSFTPLIGFHFLISFAIAYVIGGNLIASALGTSVGNPLTFPFIWASTYKLGSWILHGEAVRAHGEVHEQFQQRLLTKSLDVLLPMLKPMMVGAVPLGLICGAVCYVIVYKSVEVYQLRRRNTMDRRRCGASIEDEDQGRSSQ